MIFQAGGGGEGGGPWSFNTALIPVSPLFTSPHPGGRERVAHFSAEGLQEEIKPAPVQRFRPEDTAASQLLKSETES